MVGGAALVAVAVLGWFGWHDEEIESSGMWRWRYCTR